MATNGTSARGKSAAAKERERKKNELRAKQQLWAIVVFAFAIFIFSITLIQGQNVWRWFHDLFLGLFGWSAYLIAPILLYIAVMTTLDKPIGLVGHKVWQSMVLICLLSGSTQVFGSGIPDGDLIEKFTALFENGVNLHGGGAVSGAFGLPLMYWFGKTGAQVTMVLLIFVFVMILTGGTLVGLYHSARKPVKKIEEAYVAHAEERDLQRELNPARPIFNIDIPLDEKDSASPPAAEPSAAAAGTVAAEGSAELLNFTKSKWKKKEPEPKAAAAQADKEELPPFLDDLISKVTGPTPNFSPQDRAVLDSLQPLAQVATPEGVSFGKDWVTPVTNLADGDQALKVFADEIQGDTPSVFQEPPLSPEEIIPAEIFKEEVAPRPIVPERSAVSHEIIEVPPTVLGDEGFDHDGVAHSINAPEPEPEEAEYIKPPIDILNEPPVVNDENLPEELKANAEKLVNTLQSFGVQTRIIDIARGPAVTRYELQPSAGVKISKITNLADDIALNLAASGVRIEAPIPNKAAVGIEVPNKTVSLVSIREIIDSSEFVDAKSPLSVSLGRDIAGKVTLADLSKMPHTLIAGSTGSGKSVCINSLIISILYKSSPKEVRLLLIDPKMVELGIYNGIPHLLIPVVTDPKKAAGALSWAVNEMLNRYQLFKETNVRDIAGFNRVAQEKELKEMPLIVIVIDELADLMMAAPGEVEDSICRLAQMARAAGMHLVIATQRPSVDVITGVIKANIPSRIAFAVSSQIDSRTILDSAGAEKLLGRGDMLFAPVGASKPTRVQGCFVTDGEVERVVDFIKSSGQRLTYDQQILDDIDRHTVAEKKKGSNKDEGGGFDDQDEMLPSAIECVVETGQASTSLLQRKLKLGYARAARIMDAMEDKGVIGPFEGSKPRQILISKERWIEMKLCASQRAEDNRRNY